MRPSGDRRLPENAGRVSRPSPDHDPQEELGADEVVPRGDGVADRVRAFEPGRRAAVAPVCAQPVEPVSGSAITHLVIHRPLAFDVSMGDGEELVISVERAAHATSHNLSSRLADRSGDQFYFYRPPAFLRRAEVRWQVQPPSRGCPHC